MLRSEVEFQCEHATSGACAREDCMHFPLHTAWKRFSCGDVKEYCDVWQGFVTCRPIPQ